jgi:hypothetical protein
MWEHPFNKKRRLERAAFSQSTNNKLPKNMVNKIFDYKEILNELRLRNTSRNFRRYSNKEGSNMRSKMAHWVANTNVPGMNSSEKLKTLLVDVHSLASGFFPPESLELYIDHLQLVNSRNRMTDLEWFARTLASSEAAKRRKNIGLTPSKFLKLNAPSRGKVLNILERDKNMERLHTKYQIMAIIGNRQEMIKAVRMHLNRGINMKQRAQKKFLGNARPVNEANRKTKERFEMELRVARKRKRNLNNLSTQGLKNILMEISHTTMMSMTH